MQQSQSLSSAAPPVSLPISPELVWADEAHFEEGGETAAEEEERGKEEDACAFLQSVDEDYQRLRQRILRFIEKQTAEE